MKLRTDGAGLALLVLTLLGGAGCAFRQSAPRAVRDLDQLASPGEPEPRRVAAGILYLLQSSTALPALDIVSGRPAGELGTLVVHREARDPAERVVARLRIEPSKQSCPSWLEMFFDRAARCAGSRMVEISLRIMRTRTDGLADPFTFLEVFNRPISGLAYNQRAELRVMEWKNSLAELVAQYGDPAGSAIAVCTEVTSLLEGELIVEGALDKEEAVEIVSFFPSLANLAPATALAREVERRRASGLAVAIPVATEVILGAEFRGVGLVQSSTNPLIHFKLGGFQERSWYLHPEEAVVFQEGAKGAAQPVVRPIATPASSNGVSTGGRESSTRISDQ